MTCCARHGFVLANGVGDLQKGERYVLSASLTTNGILTHSFSYCNMDFILWSAMVLLDPALDKLSSYDINCQFSQHIRERIDRLPSHLQVRVRAITGELRYVIPKYHWYAHKEYDHSKYSLNLVPGVGRTDGEEIERNWSRHDGAAASTREMGPGSRHDTLEDHFGWANWQRLLRLGE